MNYKQNRLALALQSGKSGNIGVIVPRINTNFFGSVIRGIEEELHPNNTMLLYVKLMKMKIEKLKISIPYLTHK